MNERAQHLAGQAVINNHLSAHGPYLKQFEASLSTLVGRPVVALNSGTSAIHLALVALGVTAGQEVLCSDFTFAATAFPIAYQGAQPVFVGCEANSWNMCPELLHQAIKHRMRVNKKPAAILLAHIYGVPANIEAIRQLSAQYNIPLVEDAAEAMGSTVGGKMLGTFGQYGVWSFNGNKSITTGGGGAIICPDQAAAAHIQKLAAQAKEDAPHYEHHHIGYNYRMNNLAASIGVAQLEVFERYTQSRREVYHQYQQALGNGQTTLQFVPEGPEVYSNRWLTCVCPEATHHAPLALEVMQQLHAQKIEVRLLWKPMSQQKVYKNAVVFDNGIASRLFQYGLCLPTGPHLDQHDVHRVIAAVKACYS